MSIVECMLCREAQDNSRNAGLCPKCHSKLPLSVSSGNDASDGVFEEKCDRCKGTGLRNNPGEFNGKYYTDCPLCNGTGKKHNKGE